LGCRIPYGTAGSLPVSRGSRSSAPQRDPGFFSWLLNWVLRVRLREVRLASPASAQVQLAPLSFCALPHALSKLDSPVWVVCIVPRTARDPEPRDSPLCGYGQTQCHVRKQDARNVDQTSRGRLQTRGDVAATSARQRRNFKTATYQKRPC